MTDIRTKLVDANRKVIEGSSESRAHAKLESKGAAYSQKDLVSVVKNIDVSVNKTKQDGVVTDSYVEPVGDKDNHLIIAIHTGMVIKRQEEGLPVNEKAKQFIPDSLPSNMQAIIGYGYYPISERTQKQAHTEEAIMKHIESGRIVVRGD